MLKMSSKHTPKPETKLKGEFERNIGLQSKNNLRIFWSDVRSELKTKTGMALPPSTQDVN